MGGAQFLITDASYILTHHHSGENSWSPSLFRLQGFLVSITRLLHRAPECTVSGCAETKVCPCTHEHAHLLPVVLDRGDAQSGPRWDFTFRLPASPPQNGAVEDFLSKQRTNSSAAQGDNSRPNLPDVPQLEFKVIFQIPLQTQWRRRSLTLTSIQLLNSNLYTYQQLACCSCPYANTHYFCWDTEAAAVCVWPNAHEQHMLLLCLF